MKSCASANKHTSESMFTDAVVSTFLLNTRSISSAWAGIAEINLRITQILRIHS